MSEPNSLQLASAEREALILSLLPRTAAIVVSRHRVLSGIRWRGPYAISAAEALGGADRVRLLYHPDPASAEADERAGEIVASDLTTDVAVIRTDGPHAPELTLREDLRFGESVVMAGRDARGALASCGIVGVAGPAWSSRRGGEIARRIEFAGHFNAWLEGALVADMAGQLAAMLVPGPRGRALGIPSATIDRVLASVERHGYLPRPYLGVRLQMLWLDSTTAARFGRRASRVPIVAGVEIGSPAAGAGLEPGDLIESIDGEEIERVEQVMRALTRAGVGGSLQLRVRRGGGTGDRTITAGEQPRRLR